MVLTVLRGTFVLLCVYVGFLLYKGVTGGQYPVAAAGATWFLICVGGAIGIGLVVVAADALVPRKSLAAISGVFFGLVVGLVIAYALGLVVNLLVSAWFPEREMEASTRALLNGMKLAIGVMSCYLVISFILQTKDDIRFVIPYVEFAKQLKGARPMLLDTSVIIDGRIADIADSRLIDSQLVVPRFVLAELQAIADSSDKLKRNRGRRGLDVLNRLQGNDKVDVVMQHPEEPASAQPARQERASRADLENVTLCIS